MSAPAAAAPAAAAATAAPGAPAPAAPRALRSKHAVAHDLVVKARGGTLTTSWALWWPHCKMLQGMDRFEHAAKRQRSEYHLTLEDYDLELVCSVDDELALAPGGRLVKFCLNEENWLQAFALAKYLAADNLARRIFEVKAIGTLSKHTVYKLMHDTASFTINEKRAFLPVYMKILMSDLPAILASSPAQGHKSLEVQLRVEAWRMTFGVKGDWRYKNNDTCEPTADREARRLLFLVGLPPSIEDMPPTLRQAVVAMQRELVTYECVATCLKGAQLQS